MWGWRLNLQTYVGAASYDDAFALASSLVAAVGPTAAVADCTIKPYRKFEGQFGVRLSLDAPSLERAYQDLLAKLALDWTTNASDDEASAIWDDRLNGPGRISGVKWIHLNLFKEADD